LVSAKINCNIIETSIINSNPNAFLSYVLDGNK
jgi:hypothetical protein